MRTIRFRVWDKVYKTWADLHRYWLLGTNGELFNDLCFSDGHSFHSDNFVIQQSTGLKDKNRREVYEGDLVKFSYSVGDQLWDMTQEEVEKHIELSKGKELVGEVKWNGVSCAFEIICGEKSSTHLTFPASYACHIDSEIVGNIFENKI
jgi:uncharacterized phage protein (TIGR01671 family)